MKSTTMKIGNRIFSIGIVDDETFDQMLSKYDVDNLAEVKSYVDYDEELILIRDKLSVGHKQELVIHELLHVFFEDSGITYGNDDVEKFIKILAPKLAVGFFDLNNVMTDLFKMTGSKQTNER